MQIRRGADLGAAIAEARRQQGYTQAQLAEATGLERSYLARIEAGASVEMLDRILLLFRRLGVQTTVTLADPPAADTV